MTLDELMEPLPWGLHDAYLEALTIDWVERELRLTVRLQMTEHQDMDQRAVITISGLVFCTVEPPDMRPEEKEIDRAGYAIDLLRHPFPYGSRTLPAVPEGCFLNCIYDNEQRGRVWPGPIHFCGRNASLEWLEPAPVPARHTRRALFPGDTPPVN